jgi:hypothetical protein
MQCKALIFKKDASCIDNLAAFSIEPQGELRLAGHRYLPDSS